MAADIHYYKYVYVAAHVFSSNYQFLVQLTRQQ